ncbi:MAG TPA: LLM class flavin-dependent oxidoreductase [Beijerinckiaceae bacterium]|nr:LLM class flavin-dependent oxidoreductase [Beijerinckiaceae bacterium]
MKFSFFHLMPWTELDAAPQEWPTRNASYDPVKGKDLYDNYLATMARAEECGFDWVGANEHHFSPYSLMANCNLVGAALAQRTSRIKLAMLGNLLPLLNPIRVAEEYAMLDVMSGGRLVAGFVRGIPHEYIAYNISPDESRARMKEALSLILRAWTEPEPFGWEGEFYQYRSISIWPRPYQKPHPRILMSASNDESAEFVGQFPSMVGMTLIIDLDIAARTLDCYRRVRLAHGYETTPDDVLLSQQTCIADSDDEARAHMSEALKYFHGILMRPQQDAQRIVLQKTRFFNDDRQREFFVKRLNTLKARSLDEQIEAGSVICGSPKSVIGQIRRLHRVLGAGIININMKIGNMPDAVVERGMDLFRDEVLPALRDL